MQSCRSVVMRIMENKIKVSLTVKTSIFLRECKSGKIGSAVCV